MTRCEASLERARRRSAEQGLTNLTHQQADAQVHRFPPASSDLCISRFGTMFFTEPVAAFANIGRALRPAARLVLLHRRARARLLRPGQRTAFDAVLRLLRFKDLLADLDAAAAAEARRRLRTILDAHHTGGGVYFDSRAWIVTARRRH